jgi:hypothetical protein
MWVNATSPAIFCSHFVPTGRGGVCGLPFFTNILSLTGQGITSNKNQQKNFVPFAHPTLRVFIARQRILSRVAHFHRALALSSPEGHFIARQRFYLFIAST